MKALLVALLLLSVSAYARSPLSDAEFSKAFRCPESLPSNEARKNAVQDFLTWATQRHPNLTIPLAVELRTRLLEEHHCDKTLANIESASSQANGSPRNLCVGDDRRRYFSDQEGSNCIPVPLNHGWVNFHSEPKVVVDIMPSEIVREPDGTKIWAQFFLAEPVVSNEGGWRYDYVKSVTKYYCGSKQQLLIQGTYSLKGEPVYERSSTESTVEEIEPGTLAEELYEYACKK